MTTLDIYMINLSVNTIWFDLLRNVIGVVSTDLSPFNSLYTLVSIIDIKLRADKRNHQLVNYDPSLALE